ncbi:efflux transporter outer membrane subunit [Sulfuriferula nivalis]|uniref:Outer membrane efflux lipoprotein n=1 Tax=Sulfuriferula nivalis TaxID=2675298 RepID=A0A809SGT4_9PROT|nr:efflux transporter outer membrane subunit [Sulfuriferula nivalis]BBP00200.1 outer membrane efflux lipoprotein [Sulfuriferula nivalis]
MTIKPISLLILVTLLGGCAVGPDYVRPTMDIPAAYKESKDWKVAEPHDNELGQHWWAIYNDTLLNQLIDQIDISNQNLAQAEARYRQASALIQSARAAYFPTIGANASATRSSSNTTPDIKNLSLNASWEPDLWGRVRRTVESNEASAQASAADLRAARLSAQAALAQDYWQLRILDAQKYSLTDTVAAYQRSLQLTQNQYAVGMVAKADLIQAQTQLRAAQAQLIDLGVLRAQTEHAIALLIGQPASSFSIAPVAYTATVPAIPTTLPSALLERRPDISAAERRMAAANAQIGIAKSAYFPTLSLSASGGYQSSSLADLITAPSRIWSIGPALAQSIFDGGLRKSQTAQAIASYDASVAAYKQTVLTSFQEVEDNLATLRILENEAQVQDQTVQSAKLAVTLVLNQYKAGMVNYNNVITVQTTLLSAENSALSIANRRMAASVKLAAALGGDWQ